MHSNGAHELKYGSPEHATNRTGWTSPAQLWSIAIKREACYGGKGWNPSTIGARYTDADGENALKREATHISIRFFAHPSRREHIDEAIRDAAEIPGFVRAEAVEDSPGGWPGFQAMFAREDAR